MNNLKNYATEQLKNELLSRCQFSRPGCTETAELWGIKKLASGEIQQNHICLNCAEQIETDLAKKRATKIAQQKSRIQKHHASKL